MSQKEETSGKSQAKIIHKELCSGEVSGPSPLPVTMNDNDRLEFLSLKVLSIHVLITRHNKHHTHRNTHVRKGLDLPIVETTVPAKKKESLKSQLLSSICDSFPTGYTPFWMALVRFWEGNQSLVSMWLLYSSACCNNITVLANYCSRAGLTETEWFFFMQLETLLFCSYRVCCLDLVWE